MTPGEEVAFMKFSTVFSGTRDENINPQEEELCVNFNTDFWF